MGNSHHHAAVEAPHGVKSAMATKGDRYDQNPKGDQPEPGEIHDDLNRIEQAEADASHGDVETHHAPPNPGCQTQDAWNARGRVDQVNGLVWRWSPNPS